MKNSISKYKIQIIKNKIARGLFIIILASLWAIFEGCLVFIVFRFILKKKKIGISFGSNWVEERVLDPPDVYI